MLIIGLAGKSGVGKTTVARYLKDTWYGDEEAHIFSFSTALKKLVSSAYEAPLRANKDTVFPCPDKFIGTILEPKPRCESHRYSLRKYLQYFGTDVARSFYPHTWINFLDQKLDDYMATNLCIIDDVRFPNEVDFIKNRGGKVFKICPYKGMDLSDEMYQHESETALDAIVDSETFEKRFFPSFGEEELIAIGQKLCAFTRGEHKRHPGGI